MPKVMGKVHGYELGDPELVEQLREDLKKGCHVSIHAEGASAAISHDDDFRDTIVMSEDGETLEIHEEGHHSHVTSDQRVPVRAIRSIEIVSYSFEDHDTLPLIHWRHEPQFCGPWIFFRTEYMINTRPKDWERELARCAHTYETTQPEALRDPAPEHDDVEADIDQRERSRIQRRSA